MNEEPMGDQDDNGKGTELPNGALREEGDYPKDGVVGDNFKCVGRSRLTEADADSLLYG